MELIGYYLLFAFSTSITACYIWFWPIIQKAKAKGVNNTITQSPILGVIVYIIVTAIIAPAIVLPLLFTKMGENFARGLERALMESD